MNSSDVAADEHRVKRFAVDPVGNYLLKRPHAGHDGEFIDDEAVPLDFMSSAEDRLHKRLPDPVGSYLLRKRYVDPVGSYLLAKKASSNENAEEEEGANHHSFHGNPVRP